MVARIAFAALAMNRDGYGNLCELVSLGTHAWRSSITSIRKPP